MKARDPGEAGEGAWRVVGGSCARGDESGTSVALGWRLLLRPGTAALLGCDRMGEAVGLMLLRAGKPALRSFRKNPLIIDI